MPSLVHRITKQTTPSSKSFLGLVYYYRDFMKNFAAIASPLYELTRKDTPWIWGEEQEKSFQKLCTALALEYMYSSFP